MVGGISHDLRTPLTSIRGYIKGVLDGVADTPEKKEMYLRTAYESTGEMNSLLQKLFDFSRMESGQMPDVLLDVDQVPRIFDNLLENSIKYAKVCPVKIDIRIYEKREKTDMPGGQKECVTGEEDNVAERKGVILEWKDNGQGVPEEKLPHIFERFYRCDESRNEKGSGVGLYVVQYIMERHHGTVKAENDNGLKIQLFFPLADIIGER